MKRIILFFTFVLGVVDISAFASSQAVCLDDDSCESVIATGLAKVMVLHSHSRISLDAHDLERAAGALERHWSKGFQFDDDVTAVRLSLHQSLASQIASHPRLTSLSLSFGMKYDERPFYIDALGKLLSRENPSVPLREVCMDADDFHRAVQDTTLLQHLRDAPAMQTLKVCHIHMGADEDNICGLLERLSPLSQGKRLGLYGVPAGDEDETKLFFTSPVIDALSRSRFEHLCVSTLDVLGLEGEFAEYIKNNRYLKTVTVLSEIHLLEEEKMFLKGVFEAKGPDFLQLFGRVITHRSAPTAWER